MSIKNLLKITLSGFIISGNLSYISVMSLTKLLPRSKSKVWNGTINTMALMAWQFSIALSILKFVHISYEVPRVSLNPGLSQNTISSKCVYPSRSRCLGTVKPSE
jgi:hypothetical protein